MKTVFFIAVIASLGLTACSSNQSKTESDKSKVTDTSSNLTPEEAQAIAK